MCRSQLLHHAEDSSLSPDGQVLDADTHLTAVPLPVLAAHEWEWSRPVEAASVTCDTPALVPVHASPADSVTASPVASPTAHGVVPQATPLAVLEAHSWEWCTPEGQCGDLTALLTSRSVTDTQQPDLSTDTTCRDRIVQQAADAVTPTLVPAADTVAEEVCAVGVIPASPGVDVGVQCMLCDTHSVGQLADDSLQDFSDAVVESSATRDTLQPFEAATDALRASTSDVADEPVNTSEPQQTPLVVSEWESVRPINASDLATSARETWAHLTSSMSDTEESEETSDVRKPADTARGGVLSDTLTTEMVLQPEVRPDGASDQRLLSIFCSSADGLAQDASSDRDSSPATLLPQHPEAPLCAAVAHEGMPAESRPQSESLRPEVSPVAATVPASDSASHQTLLVHTSQQCLCLCWQHTSGSRRVPSTLRTLRLVHVSAVLMQSLHRRQMP
eukprot:TRINITY_DN170_c0_g1_i4.p1 TRINITY_DN170_c0_g1~~TRINITY_DN170_c0_g1_i4.p1  ORF type:complete len:448 (+),score=72.76 TRINITY_DN170_c0_g1_i4:435-1778(+)